MRLSWLVAACLAIAPALAAQEPARDSTRGARDSVGRDSMPHDSVVRDSVVRDSTTRARAQAPLPGIQVRPTVDSLTLEAESPLTPFGRLAGERPRPGEIARARAALLQEAARARVAALWGQATSAGFTPRDPAAGVGAAPPGADPLGVGLTPSPDSAVNRPDADSTAAGPGDRMEQLFGSHADLGLQLQSRIEAKLERNRNERCSSYQALNPNAACRDVIQPQFDFQFGVRTGGVVADRVHVDVDYDSQREFDASNNISVYYQGKPDELLERLEVGNVSFQPPASRFITAGIPSGNYGLQATGQLGPMRFRTILAQQKGNIVKDRVFTIGDRTLQNVDADIEDYRLETRRFFFTVDPRRLPGYPNLDILDRSQMSAAVASLPADARPTLVRLYRLRINEQPTNPNGPKFLVRGSRKGGNGGQVYELLQPNVDYYLDPSQLWFALVRPLSLDNERLVVAYNVAAPGGVNPATGGNPVLEDSVGRPLFANLVWDPDVLPADSAFHHEIRSIYRLGGEDVQRATVSLKVVAGSGSDQEKPVGGAFRTYLEMFGLAQPGNPSAFDTDNRLWPRPGDPNQQGGGAARLIRDYFVVFPSLRPFARRANGLVAPGSPANDTLYATLAQDLYSSQRPPSLYHLRARYDAQGGGDAGALSLGAVQLRQGSERIAVGGVPLERDIDYTIDYELGLVTFIRPDSIFRSPRQVQVRFEENPLFAAAPTSIFGFASSFPLTNGTLNFTAISQSQRTTFNRPPLGFEPASSLVAGVSGNFTFDAAPLTRAIEGLPFIETSAPSSISVAGEFATSRPRPNATGQAYVESFEGEGGVQVSLAEPAWYYASQPALGDRLDPAIAATLTDPARATTMAWQGSAVDRRNTLVARTIDQIDPQVRVAGNGVAQPEQLLWLTLYPLGVGGVIREGEPRWTFDDYPRGGRRWRSVRTSLGPSGVDLSRVETLEFWSLISVSEAGRPSNPTLIFDFGEVSENTLAFAPETLAVASPGDSLWHGRQRQGFDTLDTERDPLTRGFNVATDDRGLPGDVVEHLTVTRPGAAPFDTTGVALCSGTARGIPRLGDTRSNCTVRNNRLDEEDLDFDNVLNFRGETARGREEVRRYVVDMSRPGAYSRLGRCEQFEELDGRVVPRCWAYFRIPFSAPTDSIGNPRTRNLRSLRVTMVSGEGVRETDFQTVPVGRLRLAGSPWLKRANRAIAGVGGEDEQSTRATSYVIASLIGTQDRDSARGLAYESPPGVVDAPDSKQTGFENERVQINERSLRLLAGDLRRYDRAEAYFRFPEGQRNFMGYKELRVWARGRHNGWGERGELQFFVKIGRDPSNFYLYRTPVNAGSDNAAWLPEVRVDFDKLFALRARVQNAVQQGATANGCTGLDSALVANSRLPAGKTERDRYAACEDGYIVYTVDPGVSPPNLAAVQELAVGMVRVDSGTGPSPITSAADTLELWVDDIRLTDVVDTPGYAGQLSLGVVAGDLGDLRVNLTRIDPNFRQLAEQPSFATNQQVDVVSSLRLERLLPQSFGFAMPLTVSYGGATTDPYFLSRSDVRGREVEGLRAPRTSSVAYALNVRRTAPIATPVLGTIVNNLALSSTYATSSSRSEYQEGAARNFTVGLDYNVTPAPREQRLPGWAERIARRLPRWAENLTAVRALRGATLRWTPTQLRFTSRVQKASDRRLSFTQPAASAADSALVVRGLSNLWQSGGAIELRPFGALSLRLDASSLRDLRDYRDPLGQQAGCGRTSGIGDPGCPLEDVRAIAAGERRRALGVDVGLERERTMGTAISFAPIVSPWIQPRLDFGTQYAMLRDPNTSTLLRTGDDGSGEFRLPRRLSNSQTFTAGAAVDIGRAIALYTGDASGFRRLAAAFQPIDITYNRSLQSFFDGTPFTPGLGYQFALGGEDSFRELGGRLASSAGVNATLSVTGTVALPFGVSLTNRYQRLAGRNWTRLQDTLQRPVDAENVSFPNASLRWSYRPPAWLQPVVASVGANAGAEHTHSATFAPGLFAGAPDERASARTRRYPVSGSVAWSLLGGLSTSAGYSLTTRDEVRPGNSSFGRTRDITVDLGKSFTLPSRWKVEDRLNTRVSYQESRTQNFVRNLAGSAAETRPLANNGRHSFNVNADTRVDENLTFSLVASRIVNFDDQYNRRFTQTVLTAVLQMQFFAGEFR